MPFSEPQNLTIEVTLQDIANASTKPADLQNNIYVNSLATAIKRLRDAFQLPGIEQGENIKFNCPVIFAETNIYYSQNVPVTACDVYVCTGPYATDNNTALIVAQENVAGLKPPAPYTAYLTHL